jgi:hypothetical protein
MVSLPTKRGDFGEQLVPLRNSLWPDIASDRIWTHKSKGWTYLPKSMPLVLTILDRLSVGKPLSATYLDLWCRTRNDAFVVANQPQEMAFASGFTGERAVRTWKDRIAILRDCGFIDTKPGATGDIGFILLFNPFAIIHGLWKDRKVSTNYFNALLARLVELRSDDVAALQGAFSVDRDLARAPITAQSLATGRSPLFGSMKGTTTVAAGLDLTAPTLPLTETAKRKKK